MCVNVNTIYYFTVQKLCLQICGVWPSKNIFYRTYSYLIRIPVILYCIMIVPEMIKFENFDLFINDSLFYMPSLMSSFKIMNLWKNKFKIKKIFDDLQKEPFLPDSKRGTNLEKKIILESNNLGKILGIISPVMGIFACVLCAMLPLIENIEVLPYGKFPEYFRLNYKTKYVIQTILYVLFVFVYMTGDVVYVTMLIHIRAHCRILQNSLKLTNKTKKPMSKTCLKKILKNIVIYHNSIIDLSREVEDIFSSTNFVVFIGLSFLISSSMYGVSLSRKLNIIFFKNVQIIATAKFQIGILAYIGNEVILESTEIADACFQVEFFETDIQFQKGLVLIIQRSQKPILPTVGKYKPLSLLTFAGILRATFSYFTFLRNIGGSK